MKIELESIFKYSKNFQRYFIHALSLKNKTKHKQKNLGLNLSPSQNYAGNSCRKKSEIDIACGQVTIDFMFPNS